MRVFTSHLVAGYQKQVEVANKPVMKFGRPVFASSVGWLLYGTGAFPSNGLIAEANHLPYGRVFALAGNTQVLGNRIKVRASVAVFCLCSVCAAVSVAAFAEAVHLTTSSLPTPPVDRWSA